MHIWTTIILFSNKTCRNVRKLVLGRYRECRVGDRYVFMMIVKRVLHVYLSPRIIVLLRNRILVEAVYKSYSYLVRELLSMCLICNPRVIESLSVSYIEIMICDVSSCV